MENFFSLESYHFVVAVMLPLAAVVFAALQRIEAGYGVAYTPEWGPTIGNRIGWILMEAPVFIAVTACMLCSPRCTDVTPVLLISPFLLHYFQRSFIFPLLIKRSSPMPLTVIAMGIIFNLVNAWLIGGWVFYLAPPDLYTIEWLSTPQFIAGLLIFFCGMFINLQSDRIIRHLRKPGDKGHYIPRGGMFRYVTSANYLGELTEWIGFAVLTWSMAGLVFAVWTFANLAPRARKLTMRYTREFGEEYTRLNRRHIIPFIY